MPLCVSLCVPVHLLYAHTDIHTHARSCLSSHTAGSASCVIGAWRGWMDVRRRATTLHITRPDSPAKQTSCDWWLPSFGLVLSKQQAHPSNHRQWMAKWRGLALNWSWYEEIGQDFTQCFLVWMCFFSFFTGRSVYTAPNSTDSNTLKWFNRLNKEMKPVVVQLTRVWNSYLSLNLLFIVQYDLHADTVLH